MDQNQSLMSQLEQMLVWKKSKQFYAEKLGVTVEVVDELLKDLKKENIKEEPHEIFTKVNAEKGTIESERECNFEPKTVDQLAKLHKIDLNKYKITNYWSKLKSNGKFTSSVFATAKKNVDYTQEDFTKFLSTWKPEFTTVTMQIPFINYFKEVVDASINIADFHLAKRTKQGDTLDSKGFDYAFAVYDLVNKIKNIYDLNKVVFPISNDFFHSDTYQNTTTNGTPQETTASFDQEYERGFEILADAINYLSTQCKELEVILVQGNHDKTKGFYVAHALEVFFKEYPNVTFKRHNSTTKFTVLGNTFIGYHHGNRVKLEGLPIIFAASPDSAKAFGDAKYREIHTGDKHHYLTKEINGTGIRVQQMPSLSGTDTWHGDNLFINQIRAALALVYHPEHGKIAEFEHRTIR